MNNKVPIVINDKFETDFILYLLYLFIYFFILNFKYRPPQMQKLLFVC
jgi:hypothetical protein